MRRLAERGRFCGGREGPMQQDAFGVHWAKAGMSPKEYFHFLQYFVAEGNNLFVCR
jgi:hypothetical protein